MADLLQQASDDQVALAICFGAVLVSGMVMYFSHHVGRLTGHIRLHNGATELPQARRPAQPIYVADSANREKAA